MGGKPDSDDSFSLSRRDALKLTAGGVGLISAAGIGQEWDTESESSDQNTTRIVGFGFGGDPISAVKGTAGNDDYGEFKYGEGGYGGTV